MAMATNPTSYSSTALAQDLALVQVPLPWQRATLFTTQGLWQCFALLTQSHDLGNEVGNLSPMALAMKWAT